MHRFFAPVGLVLVLAGCSSTQGTYTPAASSAQSTEVALPEEALGLLALSSTLTRTGAGSYRILADPERAWAVLRAAYGEVGLHGEVLDEGRRVYGQRDRSVRRQLEREPLSRFLNCGSRSGLPNANSYTINLSVRTQVVPEPDGTAQLRTQVEASGRAPGGSEGRVRCGSTYELEKRIAQAVMRRTVEPAPR